MYKTNFRNFIASIKRYIQKYPCLSCKGYRKPDKNDKLCECENYRDYWIHRR